MGADKRLKLIVEAVTSNAQQALRSLSGSVKQFGDEASRQLEKPVKAAGDLGASLATLSTAATAFLADMAVRYGRMAIEAVAATERAAAANVDLSKGWDQLTYRVGVDGDALVAALMKASRGTVDQYRIMGLATKALDLGIAASTEDLTKLMEIAHVRAKRYGMDTADAFAMLVQGVASGRTIMLRQLGFLEDTDQAYETAAHSMGKNVDQLTLLEQKQAVFNAVLETGDADLQAWATTGDSATDVFGRFDATMAELTQELAEAFLPAVITVTGALADLMHAVLNTNESSLEQLDVIVRTSKDLPEMVRRFSALDEEQREGGKWIREGTKAWQERGITMAGLMTLAEVWDRGQREDATAMRETTTATYQMTKASQDAGKSVTEAASAAQKAGDIWAQYGRDVAEQAWQYASRVDDAQFSMKQAAEKAMFDWLKIERDGNERIGDTLADAAIRQEADTIRHYDKLRDLKQDLRDDLSDMEWDYQRDMRKALDTAPRWVSQALSKQFAERERIAKSGDKKALAQYDKSLMEQIKAIDPVYAKQLALLQQQYDHEESIKKREGKQDQQREQRDWEVSAREQEQALNQQLGTLQRELAEQQDEWRFNQGQRSESENRTMEQLGIDYEHSLDKLKESTNLKLADLPPLYHKYGYDSWQAYVGGWSDAQSERPLTIVGPTHQGQAPNYQGGAWDIPQNQVAVIHKHEMVLPAKVAEAVRSLGGLGAVIMIENVNVASGGRAGAKQFLSAVNEEMGQNIGRRTR
jgi:hypothetical protein